MDEQASDSDARSAAKLKPCIMCDAAKAASTVASSAGGWCGVESRPVSRHPAINQVPVIPGPGMYGDTMLHEGIMRKSYMSMSDSFLPAQIKRDWSEISHA